MKMFAMFLASVVVTQAFAADFCSHKQLYAKALSEVKAKVDHQTVLSINNVKVMAFGADHARRTKTSSFIFSYDAEMVLPDKTIRVFPVLGELTYSSVGCRFLRGSFGSANSVTLE